MEGSGGSVSLWGKRKTLHIVLAVITFGLWLLALLALYLWRKGRKGWSIATASALGLIVLLVGIGAAAPTESETTSPAIDTTTVTETTTDAAEPESEPIVLTTTFVSPRNGFSIKHPDRVLTPATQLWGFSEQPDDGFDVVETAYGAVFKGASTGVPDVEGGFIAGEDGVPFDDWVDNEVETLHSGCGVPRRQQAEITIDGQSGRISECPKTEATVNEIEATVVAGGRLYLFILLSDRSDFKAVFDAFAATIDLTPETAVDVPNPTTTFVSPRNGFSIKHLARDALTPAKALWDPVNQPPLAIDELDSSVAPHNDQFDVVETGLAAVFKGASTGIPDGASIDEWVDASVVKYLPGGCYVPRSQQAEITIDGQSGRISEDCPDKVVATVVVDGRLYLLILSHRRSDARAFFDAFAATIDLRPEAAAVP